MYQPPSQIADADMTPASALGLATANRIIIEKWTKAYPLVEWLPIDFLPQPRVEAGESAVSKQTVSNTAIDVLYGEAVALNSEGLVVQPHGTDSDAVEVDATQRKKYKTPVSINAHIERNYQENELEEYGANSRRKFTIRIPTALCDLRGLTINPGDLVKWAGQTLEIYEAFFPDRAFWKYTNIPLYIQCYARHSRIGS